MASWSVRAAAVVIFVVFCGTTDVIATQSCWSIEDITRCAWKVDKPVPKVDPLSDEGRRYWDYLKAEFSKCIEETRADTEECKSADFGPAKKVIESLFTQSPPTMTGSGVTSAASILTALVSLVLSLALSR